LIRETPDSKVDLITQRFAKKEIVEKHATEIVQRAPKEKGREKKERLASCP
jgi:hypothetical protein